MGQTQSASIPSKEEILRRTKNGKTLVNDIFVWMVEQTELRELYLLANPVHCKKYIFLTADALSTLFHKIDLEPRQGKQGQIYLAKVDRVVNPPKDSGLLKTRETICLRLAFLYVRIFQIFAALALSVLDVNPESETRLASNMQRLRQLDQLPLFGQAQRGGALGASKPLPSFFEPLRAYLNEVPADTRYYRIGSTAIYVEYGSPLDGRLPIIYQYDDVKPGQKPATKKIRAYLGVEVRGSGDELYLTLSNITKSDGIREDDVRIHLTRRMIGNVFRDKKSQEIPTAILYQLQKIARGERTSRDEDPTDVYDRQRAVQQLERETGEVAQGLHTKTLLDAFRQAQPPKAHCVARALQLVSDSGLQSAFPAEVYSQLCKTKFMTSTFSLPEADHRITREVGIYALAQLFYDTIRESAPAMSERTADQYKAFIAKLKFVFEEAKDSKVSSIDEVKSRLPTGVCAGIQDRTLQIKNREVIRLLRDRVRQMITYQIQHTANVVTLLRKLFLLPIETGKSLAINPRVLQYGMEEVSRVGEEARNLLIEYYSHCETLYRSGAEVLAANKSVLRVV
jgi:hypothetical protein